MGGVLEGRCEILRNGWVALCWRLMVFAQCACVCLCLRACVDLRCIRLCASACVHPRVCALPV